MNRLSVEYLQENFDEILDIVEQGKCFIITVDGVDKGIIRKYVDEDNPFNRKRGS